MIDTVLFDLNLFKRAETSHIRALHGLCDDGFNVGVVSAASRKDATALLKQAGVWLFVDLLLAEAEPGENLYKTMLSAFATRPDRALCVVDAEAGWRYAVDSGISHVVGIEPSLLTFENVKTWVERLT